MTSRTRSPAISAAAGVSCPQAVSYLNSFVNYEKKLASVRPADFQLERMKELLSRLGHPDRGLRILHVAGTKGKGSTAACTASILREAGFSVGLYTSPHFYSLRERIRVLRPVSRGKKTAEEREFEGSIPAGALRAVLREISPVLETLRSTKKYGELTYFEVLTAAALVYFQRKEVDYAVLETGLGGRLDATNAAESLVAAITPVSLDHTQILGATLEAIAKEKAAIIKRKGQGVVVGRQDSEAGRVIAKRCRQMAVSCWQVGHDINVQCVRREMRGDHWVVQTPQACYAFVSPLLGQHQADNAAIAIALIEKAGLSVPSTVVARGIAHVAWPGRFEIIAQNPAVVLDCAHNPHSLTVLVQTLQEYFSGRDWYFVVGTSSDKDWQGILRVIVPVAKEIVLTKARHPRALDWAAQRLPEAAAAKIFSTDNFPQAIKRMQQKARSRDIVVVTGSVFLVSEARRMLRRMTISRRKGQYGENTTVR